MDHETSAFVVICQPSHCSVSVKGSKDVLLTPYTEGTVYLVPITFS